MPDHISYLNGSESSPMSGSLESALESLPAKMQRAPAKEWEAALKGLVSRGKLKQAEIDDSEIVIWMGKQPVGPIARADLVRAALQRRVTIKEVILGSPQYQSYSHARQAGEGSRYREVLYLGNAEADNIEDRLEAIDWELEQFNFDVLRMSEDPLAIFRLTDERKQLMEQKPVSFEFSWAHFTHLDRGRLGKNMIAHSRELSFGNTFLVEEIQSDWGQRGRKNNWASVPRGPFVTDTKLWAGLVMRRLMQRAALNPAVEKFFWIRGGMKNGGSSVAPTSLDEFYLKTMSGKRTEFLSSDAVMEVLKAGSIEEDLPYIHGDWTHLFSIARREDAVRFVFDTRDDRIVAMQVADGPVGGSYVNATSAQIADVEDSLKNANPGALEDPDDWGLTRAYEPPAWAIEVGLVERESEPADRDAPRG